MWIFYEWHYFFALNHICSKLCHFWCKSHHCCPKSLHFCTVLHHFTFDHKRSPRPPETPTFEQTHFLHHYNTTYTALLQWWVIFWVSNRAATTTLLKLDVISSTDISFYDITVANCVIKNETLRLFFMDLISYLCFTPLRTDIVHVQIQTKPVSSGLKTWQWRCQFMSLF